MNPTSTTAAHRVALGTLVLALLAALVPLPAQETLNPELRAVPAPGKVTIDGRLDDWDTSGGILICEDIAKMADNHSVMAYAMYDDHNFYVAFHFKDFSPMVNHVNPQLDPGMGWRSDCVQLRFRTDYHVPVHVDAYYFTDEHRPTMYIQYSDFAARKPPEKVIPEALEAGAAMAFRKDDDGKGYVQEIRLPWQLLREKDEAYHAGDSFRMGIETFWGDASAIRWPELRIADLINPDFPIRQFFGSNEKAWGKVTLLDHGHLPAAPPAVAKTSAGPSDGSAGVVPLKYELPADGFVSLVIEDPQGRRIANPIANAPRKAGANVDFWNGADDNGHLAAPGTYRYRGIFHKDLDALYQWHFNDPGNPPWFTGSGKGSWLANHTNTQAVATDDQAVYLAAPLSEGPSQVSRFDLEGRKQWDMLGLILGLGTSTALAVDDRYLYVLLDTPGLYYPIKAKKDEAEVTLMRLDKATGAFVGWPDQQKQHVLDVWPLAKLPPLVTQAQLWSTKAFDAASQRTQVFGLAVDAISCYVPLYVDNQVLVLDKSTGLARQSWPVPHPAGIAMLPDGGVAVISDRQVLRLDPTNGQTRVLVADGQLHAPIALAADRTGNLYVSDWLDRMCVDVFSPDGRLLRTVGKIGGRPMVGGFDETGMLLPRGLGVDAQGKLWVAEDDDAPRRTSVWDSGGKLLKDFIGRTIYEGMTGYINPDDPTQAFDSNTEFKLDWSTMQSRPVRTLWRPNDPLALFGTTTRYAFPAPLSNWATSYRPLKYKGRQFLVSSPGEGAMTVLLELHGESYRPLFAVGGVSNYLRRMGEFAHGYVNVPLLMDHRWPDAVRQKLIADGVDLTQPTKVPETTCFLWSDQNGDGLVQESEIQFFDPTGPDGKIAPWGAGWHGVGIDRDLSIYPYGVGGGTEHIYRVPVHDWTACGAPVYRPQDAQAVAQVPSGEDPDSLWLDGRGDILSVLNPLTLFSPEGKVLWTYPNRWPGVHGSHSAPQPQPGTLMGPFFVAGSGQLDDGTEVFAMTSNVGQAFLLTADGFYIGELLQDGRTVPPALPEEVHVGESLNKYNVAGDEAYSGWFFRNPRDRHFYLVWGKNAGIIMQVTGLDTLRRLPGGTCELSAERYQQAAEQLAARSTETVRHGVMIARAAKPPVIDGRLEDWNQAADHVADFNFDANHEARAIAAYDDRNLYLAWQVRDDSPWLNAAQDPAMAYKGGDGVVVDLGGDPKADPARQNAVAGDMRLVIAPVLGRNAAVLYDFVHPGSTSARSFNSPGQHTAVDRVEILSDAQIAVQKSADGYVVEAAVPLDELGLKLQAGSRLRGDFGVIYSNTAGTADALRMHWSNKATGLVDDTAIELRPEPALWGEFDVQ